MTMYKGIYQKMILRRSFSGKSTIIFLFASIGRADKIWQLRWLNKNCLMLFLNLKVRIILNDFSFFLDEEEQENRELTFKKKFIIVSQ